MINAAHIAFLSGALLRPAAALLLLLSRL